MKYGVTDQDKEDFEQEKLIKEWADKNKKNFDYKHITRNGTAKNTLVKADFSLDQNINQDTDSRFEMFISQENILEASSDVDTSLWPKMKKYLKAMGFKEKGIECLLKIWKLSVRNDLTHFMKFLRDLE